MTQPPDNRYTVTHRNSRTFGWLFGIVAVALLVTFGLYWTGIWSPTSMREREQGAGLHLPETQKTTQPGIPHTGGREQR